MGCKLAGCTQGTTGVQHCKCLIILNGFKAWGRLVASQAGVGESENLQDTAFK